MDAVKQAEALQQSYQRLKEVIAQRIVGQHTVIEQLFIALLCKGHVLLVGVPGLAKTLMVRSLGEVLDLEFNRIQFTPDLMPTDILGTEILEIDPESGKRYFRFEKGPIFTQLLLADEINRTPPKTQAALLEAMQEHKVTVAGKTYPLKLPFFVLATQNPIEQEGTYPLPEAQLDRFMFELRLDYPSEEEEIEIVERTTKGEWEPLPKVMDAETILQYQQLVYQVPVSKHVVTYAVRLVQNSRRKLESIKQWVRWGAGPRASQYLILAAKAYALLRGKLSPDVEDVQSVAHPVLRHRIIPSFIAEAEGIDSDKIIQILLEQTPTL